ncbi:MAG TPA: hypothetical protein VNW53_13105 [Phenylobacterium sp.]|jgi:hypothetical protein|uniref:hypothetical protein n=1 Tax=Phenylobacterium sp. TaxID=1871053 RepID=UPI002CB13377|nr:hypothetical protein [Phenylobacterium sp.]HXA39931.1 hypothetical protein [Phenylobacterium sp.]
MAQAITRLFDRHEDAVAAVRQLEQAGIPHEDISLIANNADGRHRLDGDHAGDGAAKGATTGGLVGGGAGLLAGLGMLAIPGLGPVVAAGWLVSTAVGAAIGAAAGGATGGLLGALKDAGHTEEEAHVYAEGVRRGGTLISVRPRNDTDRATAERILAEQRGVDATERGAAYRAAGWQSFDPAAAPYSADQIARERSSFAEGRSFADREPMTPGDSMRTEPRDGSPADPMARPTDPTLRDL